MQRMQPAGARARQQSGRPQPERPWALCAVADRVGAFPVAVAALTALSLALAIATQASAGPVSRFAPPYEQEPVWL